MKTIPNPLNRDQFYLPKAAEDSLKIYLLNRWDALVAHWGTKHITKDKDIKNLKEWVGIGGQTFTLALYDDCLFEHLNSKGFTFKTLCPERKGEDPFEIFFSWSEAYNLIKEEVEKCV